jgi:hypothetical protein
VVIKPGLIRIGLVLSSALLGLYSSKDVASGFTHHTFMLRAPHTYEHLVCQILTYLFDPLCPTPLLGDNETSSYGSLHENMK